jgi:hypothetical protein
MGGGVVFKVRSTQIRTKVLAPIFWRNLKVRPREVDPLLENIIAWYRFHGCNRNRDQTEDCGCKFLSFYHFSVFTGGLKMVKSFDLELINSMFLFAVLFERLFMQMFCIALMLLSSWKWMFELYCSWETNLCCDCWYESDFCWDV